MPINRCIIKNEYNLGDPDLYNNNSNNNNNKDDPEGLLEGVAMSGLVGLLRQLGDLAQFAAEIFHDLHEEVMATAARGHSLTVRVQQLEAEFPLVERKLLSQTSHTSFLYNSGIDWHPTNPRMDQNLVANGDLPRFVMDSYEECRGPPRLFLLDKFDVAGAGACLKRFTDPSFFKAESASSTGRNSGQREKKTRKLKKRGSRWRNGDTPESFPSSHAKLHQLFLEESIETGACDPQRRVKLKKKQFSGSQFDHDKGKSYMERILDSYSPKRDTVHDICIDALPLTWRSEDDCESGLEMVEKESIETDKSVGSSPNTMERVNPSMDGQELANGESKYEVSVDDVQDSDDGTSEIDNYMDALAAIESEVETDSSECNRNTCYSNLRPIVVDSDPSEGRRELQSFDSHSVGNSVTSEDSSNFFRERKSTTCSVSMDSMGETTPDLDHQPSNIDIKKMSVDHHSMSEVLPGNVRSDHPASSGVTGDADGNSLPGKISNISCLIHQNTMVLQEDDDDYTSGLRDQEHVNPTATWSFAKTSVDAHNLTDSGHLSHEDFPIHVRMDGSDGLPNKLQIEPKHTDLDALSVEEHGKHMNLAGSDNCSDIRPPLTCQPISDTTYTTDDFVSAVVDPSTKEISADVQTEEEAERAPVINQTKKFHPDSDRPLSAAPGSLDTVETGKLSPVVGPSEIQDQCHKPPKQVDADPSEHKLVEPGELNPCSEITIEELPVDSSGDECKDMAAGASGAVYQDISHSKELKPVETFEHLDISENKEAHAYDTSDYSHNHKHDDENKVFSHPDYAKHIQTAKYIDREESLNSTTKSAELVLMHSSQPMMNSNTVFLGNDDSISNSQAKQEVEDYAQLVYPQGFPVLGVVPAEPPVNLDAPPLPPLPPMQWRLSRFQNSSEASQCSMEQHNVDLVEPVLATDSEVAFQNNVNKLRTDDDPSFTTPSTSARFQNGTQSVLQNASATPRELELQHTFAPTKPIPAIVANISSWNNQNRSNMEDRLSFSTSTSAISHFGTQDVYVTQEGVHTRPMLASVSDETAPDNMNGVRREDDLLLATPESTESHIGQNLEQSHESTENHHEHGSLLEDVSSARQVPDMMDVKVDVDANGQTEQHEHSPKIPEQVEENSQAQLPPPVTQPPPGFVAPVPGMMWSGSYDGMLNNVEGNANGTLQKKLPRPRNPLIDEVVAIDKSKLRKVERVKPALEPKIETGESILEQMQLRKVDRVKVPIEAKADEVVSLLENLQLRKVGERVKAPPLEQKAKDRNFLLGQVQLRKVGDGVKPQVGHTTKEREESLEQFQLRKVGERTNPKVEDKSEGTESLRVRLRKVGERSKSEVEEIESPRVQLRKVEDRVKLEVNLKPEETESPRMQLRKVSERTHSLAVSKTEDRDSLLEQIRNKSFNLKPADVGRLKIQAPNIQGPRTNLKVVAIIEKASNIRQAMVGSDEEDDTDTWE